MTEESKKQKEPARDEAEKVVRGEITPKQYVDDLKRRVSANRRSAPPRSRRARGAAA